MYQVTEPVDHGEGPTWSEQHQLLYFVDLHAGRIITYDPFLDKTKFLQLKGDVTIVIPTKSDPNSFIVANNRSIIHIELDDDGILKNETVLVTVADDKPDSRFNDGKADSNGRLWVGTMGYENSSGVVPNEGTLYFIDKNNINKPEIKINPVNISNGLTWNKANDKFFYIDTPTRKIIRYDYDAESANIYNEMILFDLNNYALGGHPDGMTIDEDDNLWIALNHGGSVIKVNSHTGELLQKIAIPAQQVTSVAFGGPSLRTLYVTTSRYNLNDEDRLRQPAAGSLFAITNLNTKGLHMYEADIVD